MTSRIASALVASALLVAAPNMATPAAAQSSPVIGKALPVVLWAVTGAVIGAVVWPMVVGGTAAAAAPGVMSAGALLNTGAAIGTVVGGAGYLATR